MLVPGEMMTSKFSDKMRRVWLLMITPHSPRNVMMWFFYRLLGCHLAVFLYRRAVLPVVLRRVISKKKINVVFLPMNVAMWRYDGVCRRMLADERFNVQIVTAPSMFQTRELQRAEQRRMVDYFTRKGFPVVAGLDEEEGAWISLKRFKPDLIFYTQPYDGTVAKPFSYWTNFGALFCCSPYSFFPSGARWFWGNTLQNLAWRYYLPLDYHKEVFRTHAKNGAENAVPVGYFFEEEYRLEEDCSRRVKRVWKEDARKRVVWAPHHSIVDGAESKVSSFLDICDAMVELRERYRGRVVFAFKPHPMLKMSLYRLWGAHKTDSYYEGWAKAENSFVSGDSFVTLFAGSDALIHCSLSFTIDYLYTGKPVQYVYSKTRNAPDFGAIGREALSAHYPAHDVADIERFIEDVVLAGNDPKRKEREDVYQKYLKSPNGKTFSENVVEDILKGLGRL